MDDILPHDGPSLRHMLNPFAPHREDQLLQLLMQGDSAQSTSDCPLPLDVLGRGQLLPDAWVQKAGDAGSAVRRTAACPGFDITREVPVSELFHDPRAARRVPGTQAHSPQWLLQSVLPAWLWETLPDPQADGLFGPSELSDGLQGFLASP